MANAEENPEPYQQPRISFIDERLKNRLVKYMKIMKDFEASNDQAITLACASVYEDQFYMMKRRELQLPDMSLLLCMLAKFNQNGSRKTVLFSQRTMLYLSRMRMELATELFQNGLIHDDVSSYCLNSQNALVSHMNYLSAAILFKVTNSIL